MCRSPRSGPGLNRRVLGAAPPGSAAGPRAGEPVVAPAPWRDHLEHRPISLLSDAQRSHGRERPGSVEGGGKHQPTTKRQASTPAASQGSRRSTDADEAPAKKSEDGGADEDNRVGRIYDVEVTIESFNEVKAQFLALGVIEKGLKRRSGSDTTTYRGLTDRAGNTEAGAAEGRLSPSRRSPNGGHVALAPTCTRRRSRATLTHHIQLVFKDLQVSAPRAGDAPFRIPVGPGPDSKWPLSGLRLSTS